MFSIQYSESCQEYQITEIIKKENEEYKIVGNYRTAYSGFVLNDYYHLYIDTHTGYLNQLI